MTHSLNVPYMVENGYLEGQAGHLTTLPDCPYLPFWPEIWKWKDLNSMIDVLALYILYKLNLKIRKTTLEIQPKQ